MCCWMWQWNSASPGWSAVKSTMQVHRVGVVGTVAHDQPVSSALLQHKFTLVRIWLAVHQPEVELPCVTGSFSKISSMVC